MKDYIRRKEEREGIVDDRPYGEWFEEFKQDYIRQHGYSPWGDPLEDENAISQNLGRRTLLMTENGWVLLPRPEGEAPTDSTQD